MKIEEYLLERFNGLKDKRKIWEPSWSKIEELCYANAKIYEQGENQRYRQTVYDSTGRNALTYFAAAWKSILVPSTEQWHRLKPSNPQLEENEEVRAYLQYVTKLLFKIRYAPHSQFAPEADVLFNQLGMYGFAVWYVADEVGKGIIYRTIPANEVYIDESCFGVVDTVYRLFTLTAQQAYEYYGESISDTIKGCLEHNKNQRFTFLHAVEPRRYRNPKAKDYTGMPFASYHLELGTNKVVKEGGYRVMPYMIPRFLKIAGTAYGDSPAMQALADMLTANEMAKTILRTGQLQANPPILTSMGLIDASKLGSAGAVVRGGLDSQGRPAAISMQYGNNLSVTIEMQREVRAAIERAFLVPLFQALTKDKEMTATEVEKREMEKSMLLAPMCERIAAEWLSGMIERELDILSQYGLIDDVPDELMEDGAIAIEFESPFIHMQETAQIIGLYKTIESAMTMAQVDPSVLDTLNMGEAIRKIADFNDVDMATIRTRNEIAQLGEQRAQMEEAQNLLGASAVLSKSMKNLGIKGKAINDIRAVETGI